MSDEEQASALARGMTEATPMVAWCNMKIAECDREVEMARLVGMERVAAPFARDARFLRAIVAALTDGANQAAGDDA